MGCDGARADTDLHDAKLLGRDLEQLCALVIREPSHDKDPVRDVGDGAFQILQKPIKLDLLLAVLDRAHRAAMTRRQNCCHQH